MTFRLGHPCFSRLSLAERPRQQSDRLKPKDHVDRYRCSWRLYRERSCSDAWHAKVPENSCFNVRKLFHCAKSTSL